jgi:putative protease
MTPLPSLLHFFLFFSVKKIYFYKIWIKTAFFHDCKQKRKEVVMVEEKIGEVVKFFAKPSVAAVKVTEGEVNVNDTLKFFGHTTDLTQVIDSMEVNNQKVEKAVVGDYIGIKVSDRVRPGDEVFKVIP